MLEKVCLQHVISDFLLDIFSLQKLHERERERESSAVLGHYRGAHFPQAYHIAEA